MHRFHRETQTLFVANAKSQTVREMATQMSKAGCHVSTEQDRVIRSSRYMTADQYHAFKVCKVIILQCFFRQTLARIKTKQMRISFRERFTEQKEVCFFLLLERSKESGACCAKEAS